MHLEHRDEQWSIWFDTLAENDFVVIDDFLPDHLLSQVLHFFKQQETEFRPAKIGLASVEQRIPVMGESCEFTNTIRKLILNH